MAKKGKRGGSPLHIGLAGALTSGLSGLGFLMGTVC